MKPDPVAQFEAHQDTYQQIETSLSQLNDTFLHGERTFQKVLLKDATTYAVMSVQNSISLLRRGFRGYARSSSWRDVQDACRNINYGNNKFRYIAENHRTIDTETGDEIIDLLEDGDVWTAVGRITDDLLGMQYIKASFAVAMLGFTNVACLDTNVAQMVDGVEGSGYTEEEEYRQAVDKMLETFPQLSEQLDPFMVQWVCFDTNRDDGVATHGEWWEEVLPGSQFARQESLGAFQDG